MTVLAGTVHYATCRKQGHSAWRFLQNALSAYHSQTPAPSLLPKAM